MRWPKRVRAADHSDPAPSALETNGDINEEINHPKQKKGVLGRLLGGIDAAKNGLAKAKRGLEVATSGMREKAAKVIKKVELAGKAAVARLGIRPNPEELAKKKARAMRLEHLVKDWQAMSFSVARAAVIRAERNVQKSIDDEVERRRILRELEAERLAREKAYREMLLRQCRIAADAIWDNVYSHAMTEGVRLVIAKRAYEAFLRERHARVIRRFEVLVGKVLLRDKALANSYGVIQYHLLPNVFRWHSDRQRSAIIIQCLYRSICAKRELLLKYLLYEHELLSSERYQVWLVWKARLERAIQSIAHVETEEHRRIKRMIWARTEFSNQINDNNTAAFLARKPVEPQSVDSWKKPYPGETALKLPDTDASRIIASIGREGTQETQMLDWIGVPVGVSVRKSNEKHSKEHFKMVYQPLSTYTLGVDLSDSRGRKAASKTLQDFRALSLVREEALQERIRERQSRAEMRKEDTNILRARSRQEEIEQNQFHLISKSQSNCVQWFEDERHVLWNSTESILNI